MKSEDLLRQFAARQFGRRSERPFERLGPLEQLAKQQSNLNNEINTKKLCDYNVQTTKHLIKSKNKQTRIT